MKAIHEKGQDGALNSRQAKACMESDVPVNQLMLKVENVDTRRAVFYERRQLQEEIKG